MRADSFTRYFKHMDFLDEVLFSSKLIGPNYSRHIKETSVFSWTISLQEFQTCQQNPDLCSQRLRSPEFPQNSDGIFKWYLKLYPYENENGTVTRYSSIFLYINATNKIASKVLVKCHIILCIKNDKIHTTTEGFYARDQNEDYGDWEFMETELLEAYLLDGPVKIDVYLSVNDVAGNCPRKKFNSLKTLCNDYLNLLNNSTFSDVTIWTKNNAKFKVHSNILAARSNVFAAMLTDEMTESRTKNITIEDCSEITISHLLNFIYGCKVQFRSIEETLDLLKASDKYELLDLQSQCLEYLSLVADKENAYNLFCIAENYDLPELKKNLLDFMRKNKTKFADSSFYEEILAEKPQLLVDITTYLAKDTKNDTNTST